MAIRSLAIWVLVFCSACVNSGNPLMVTGESGQYLGHRAETPQIVEFLGIPFAQPPVGELRWQAPQADQTTGVVDAAIFRPGCMQTLYMVDWYHDLIDRFGGDKASFPVPEFSEDCLYLNVWTPSLKATEKLPIMVFIHGGGFRGGWAYEPNYVGDRLAQHGVVVISIAYRLDIFGFISNKGLATANYGLLDQIAALKWIRKNAAAFGGDADNVTLFGESAGGASIGYLMASADAKGLFHRAIVQSAGYELTVPDRREDFITQWDAAAQADFANGRVERMREISAAEAMSVAERAYPNYRPDAVVDGHSVALEPATALATGQVAPVDLMIGSNADEWLMYLDPESDDDDVVAWVEVNAPSVAAELESELSGNALRKLDRLTTGRNFACPALRLAEYARENEKAAYLYYFDRVRDSDYARNIGAYHGAELPYVFDKHDEWLPTDDVDRRLTNLMQRYWTNFARTGDPNDAGLPVWNGFREEGEHALNLGDNVGMISHPERKLCEYLARRNDSEPQ